MLLYVFQTPFVTPVQATQVRKEHILGKTIFPSIEKLTPQKLQPRNAQIFNLKIQSINATLIEKPVLWIGRICIFYALLKIGLAGSKSNPFFPDSETEGDDLGFFKWFQGMKGKSEEREANDRRKLVSKWHATTKGTLKRNYRVPSKAIGMRLLKSIAALLSDDDHFIDATSHKGCQIRRETAHGESVCCNNVRALFDELPTPHIVVEITAFPAGPLTDKDYVKAEKLEKVLRSGASI